MGTMRERMSEWRVQIIMAEATETEATITTDATPATGEPIPKAPPRNWISIGDEETTFEGVTMSLSEAQRRSQVRDVEDAMRNRAVHEKWQAEFQATFDRKTLAEERQATALERIATAAESDRSRR